MSSADGHAAALFIIEKCDLYLIFLCTVRRSFPPAYPVGHQLFGEAVVQNLYFYQEEDRIMDYNQAEYFFMEKSLPRIGFTKEQAAEEDLLPRAHFYPN